MTDEKRAFVFSGIQKLLFNDVAKIKMSIDFKLNQINILDDRYYLSLTLNFCSNIKKKQVIIAFEANVNGEVKPTDNDEFNKHYSYIKTNFNFDSFDVLEMENMYFKCFEKNLENIKQFQLYERGL